jgi:hypothetical protein
MVPEMTTDVDKEIQRVVRHYTEGYRTLSRINGSPVALVSRMWKMDMVRQLLLTYGLTDDLVDHLLQDVQSTNKAMSPSEITPLLQYYVRTYPPAQPKGAE